jgi:H+-translocating NAD(P) transhydrogenase subunit alpha
VIVASTLTINLAVLVLAGFIGFVVISKVPNTLHTPLMSGTNAIHGIVLLGGLLVVGLAGNGTFNKIILVIAIAFGTINIVGGFLVTDRMLEMFKSKPKPKPAVEAGADGRAGAGGPEQASGHGTAPTSGHGTAPTTEHGTAPTTEHGTAPTTEHGTAPTTGHGTAPTSEGGTAPADAGSEAH